MSDKHAFARLFASAGFLLIGCSVYDAKLYKAAPDDHAEHGNAKAVAAADECSSDAPQIETSGQMFLIDTQALGDGTSATRCLGRAAPGRDGYMRIALERGERWHFHVEPEGSASEGAAQDAALYVRSECSDDRECVQGADACLGGRAEHFTFTAPSTGTYFVGVDDQEQSGGLYLLEAYRPRCNDGKREHGEACDPSVASDSGCSEDCRWMLEGVRVEEREVNDDYAFANAVQFADEGDRQVEIAGSVTGCPSADWFTVEVEEGASIEAQLLDVNGAACAKDAGLALTLLDEGRNRVAIGSVQDDAGKCPIIDARAPSSTGLKAGRYYVVIDSQARLGENAQVNYRLALTLR